jgi:hypothetical protein
MSKNDKPSKRRYKAMLEDVAKRVRYAVYVGDRTNPYEADDKRHDRFTRELFRALAAQDDFNDMCDIMGTDTSGWTKRVHPKPGPVVPLERLI